MLGIALHLVKVSDHITNSAPARTRLRVTRAISVFRRQFFLSAPYGNDEKRRRPFVPQDRAKEAIMTNECHRRVSILVIVVRASRREDRVPALVVTQCKLSHLNQASVIPDLILMERIFRFSFQLLMYFLLSKLRRDRTRNVVFFRNLIVRRRIFPHMRATIIANVSDAHQATKAIQARHSMRLITMPKACISASVQAMFGVRQGHGVRVVASRRAIFLCLLLLVFCVRRFVPRLQVVAKANFGGISVYVVGIDR